MRKRVTILAFTLVAVLAMAIPATAGQLFFVDVEVVRYIPETMCPAFIPAENPVETGTAEFRSELQRARLYTANYQCGTARVKLVRY